MPEPEVSISTGKGDQRPVPDPTLLTTEALRREVSLLKDVITEQITHRHEIVQVQFNGVAEKLIALAERTEEQKADCVEASTPILCADLIWRPAEILCVGDELITVDEQATTEPGKRCPRRFRRGVVTANSLDEDDLVSVITPEGKLLCNAQHPLLISRNLGTALKPRYRYWQWVPAGKIREGDKALRPTDVWDTEQTWDAGWLAGILDGEGCLHLGGTTGPRISIVQRVSPTADLIEQTLKMKCETSTVFRQKERDHHSEQKVFQVSRRADIMMILGSVRPPRLLVNANKVWENESIGGKFRSTLVTNVELAGRGTIARLSVSTGTYIANGFASHNTKQAVDAALQAAKEAVSQQTEASERSIAKSELATTKQIDALGVLLQNSVGSTDEKINDLKSRMDRIEAAKTGGAFAIDERRNAGADQRAVIGFAITALLFLITLTGFIIAITQKK